MNQKSRQKALISVERDLFKLLNNSNFGIDCQNNIDNCTLQPLYDDIGEISYIKKFTAILNDDIFRHFSHHVTWKKIILTFQEKILSQDAKNDPCYEH